MMDPFSLLVKPASADCNLRCAYCFYLDRASLYPHAKKHRMTDRTLETMIRTFMATEQPQHVFGWQGGEPTLMGVDFFRRATELQKKYGRSGSVVANGLQTNATLMAPELARHLAEYSFLVGVSLDGPPDMHDTYRRTLRGGETHKRVLEGIRLLRENKVEFNILTLVSKANVRKPREVYDYLTNEGFLYQQYIECVEFAPNGRLMPFAVGGEEWGDFLCGIFDQWIRNDSRRVSIRLFDSIVTLLLGGPLNVCSMGTNCRQYFVVEHNGDVYPCDFFVEKGLRLGNVMEDSWSDLLASPAYAEFGARKGHWSPECSSCDFLRYCRGDCPKNRRDAGRGLSELCIGWKRFYSHALPGFRRLAEELERERRAAEIPPQVLVSTGRNDPCPCGSGKKYKRCCGAAK